METWEIKRLRLAFNWIICAPEKRSKLTDNEKKEMEAAFDKLQWQAAKYWKEFRGAVAAIDAKAHEKRLKVDTRYAAEHAAKKAADEAASLRWEKRSERISASCKIGQRRRQQYVDIGKAVVEKVFDTVKIAGKPIGDIWYSELRAYRDTGIFEAKICEAILRHGKPTEDKKIRNLLPEKVLAAMVEQARRPSAYSHQVLEAAE